ncbi:MAG: hypothetical protein ACRCYR_06225 [Phycicoccus sp.]
MNPTTPGSGGETTDPVSGGGSGGGLAETGSSPLPALGLGAALIAAGVGLVVATRRGIVRRH